MARCAARRFGHGSYLLPPLRTMMVCFVDRLYIDVTDRESALRLTRRLTQARSAELIGEPPCLVVASFTADTSDLADLLREVESWVDDESLCAIRFLLDDRIYVLVAGEADWTAHPWRETLAA